MVTKTRKRQQTKSENGSSSSSAESSPEKGAEISNKPNDGSQIKNMFKLEKARKWIGYEWIYSNIDMHFFMENNFRDLLATLFPRLKASQLTKAEWRKIRSLMVKNSQYRIRRCSSVFFHDERVKLERSRRKMRLIKQYEIENAKSKENSPPSNIGAAVTVFSKKNNFKIQCGTLQAVHLKENSYEIKINDGKTVSVPDIEFCIDTNDDGMTKIKPQNCVEDFVGNFPEGLLKTIVSFQKVLELKREKLKCLRNLINAAKASASVIDQDFASSFLNDFVVDLEILNTEITENCEKLKGYKIIQGLNAPMKSSDAPIQFREKSTEIISEQLEQLTNDNFHPSVMRLIQILSTYAFILIECDKLAANQYHWLDTFLSEHLEELKDSIQYSENIAIFNNKVQPVFNVLINSCLRNDVK